MTNKIINGGDQVKTLFNYLSLVGIIISGFDFVKIIK